MDVFISADMEGITGVSASTSVVKGADGYAAGRDHLVADVNAAIEGAAEAGAASITVNDSHATMTNLPRDAVDDRADLVTGNSKPFSMMQGSEGHDVALFVGYHAKAGTEGAVLNHTFLAHELHRVRIDGDEVGEMGCNARMAWARDVPVGLVTGDDATVAEAAREVGEDVETLSVKEGIDRFSARCRPPGETGEAITAAAQRAVERARNGDFDVRSVPTPVTVSVEWAATNHAARASQVRNADRTGGRETRLVADSMGDAYRGLIGMVRAGAAARDEYYG